VFKLSLQLLYHLMLLYYDRHHDAFEGDGAHGVEVFGKVFLGETEDFVENFLVILAQTPSEFRPRGELAVYYIGECRDCSAHS
jgi:hypothetical protein